MPRSDQLGPDIADLDLMTSALVNDMFNENNRDRIDWREETNQADMDRIQLKKCGLPRKYHEQENPSQPLWLGGM